eukprot:3546152-Lingulodinium_polyedra.AAC.1
MGRRTAPYASSAGPAPARRGGAGRAVDACQRHLAGVQNCLHPAGAPGVVGGGGRPSTPKSKR